MHDLQKIKQLIAHDDPDTVELGFYLLAHANTADHELGQLIYKKNYVERCLNHQCRSAYPFIHEAKIVAPTDHIDSFWAELRQLSNLRHLSILSPNPNPLWGPAVASLQHLQELYLLGENQLSSLPHELGQLRRLTCFSLSNENIDLLPDFILEFHHLQKLYLLRCPIQRLPDWIVQLQHLHSLTVHDTPITELPMSIGFLPELRNLSLTSNQLQRLPPTLRQLRQLKHLVISSNPLSPKEKQNWYKALPDTIIY